MIHHTTQHPRRADDHDSSGRSASRTRGSGVSWRRRSRNCDGGDSGARVNSSHRPSGRRSGEPLNRSLGTRQLGASYAEVGAAQRPNLLIRGRAEGNRTGAVPPGMPLLGTVRGECRGGTWRNHSCGAWPLPGIGNCANRRPAPCWGSRACGPVGRGLGARDRTHPRQLRGTTPPAQPSAWCRSLPSAHTPN